jgi:polyphosphate kinase
VRGICCLRPGIRDLSETITVTSIVGRFLEHSRIYYFRNGGEEEIYLGSADLMPRNLDRRVETLFPVHGSGSIEQVKGMLAVYLSDNVKARRMNPDGSYSRVAGHGQPVNAQSVFLEQAKAAKKPLAVH